MKKVILVTGAYGGIGEGLVRSFLKNDYEVVYCGIGKNLSSSYQTVFLVKSMIEENHPEFEAEDITSFLPEEWVTETAKEGHITLMPHKTGTDCFFISRMRRKD